MNERKARSASKAIKPPVPTKQQKRKQQMVCQLDHKIPDKFKGEDRLAILAMMMQLDHERKKLTEVPVQFQYYFEYNAREHEDLMDGKGEGSPSLGIMANYEETCKSISNENAQCGFMRFNEIQPTMVRGMDIRQCLKDGHWYKENIYKFCKDQQTNITKFVDSVIDVK